MMSFGFSLKFAPKVLLIFWLFYSDEILNLEWNWDAVAFLFIKKNIDFSYFLDNCKALEC